MLVGTYPEGNVETTSDVLIALDSLNAFLREVAREVFRCDDKPPTCEEAEPTDHWLHRYNKWDILPLSDCRIAGVLSRDTTPIKMKQASRLGTHREES